MTLKRATVPSLVFLSCLLLACAAQTQQGAAPATPLPPAALGKKVAPEPSASPIENAPLEAESAQNTEPALAPETQPELEPELSPAPKPRVAPLDVLTGSGTDFVIDYRNSSARTLAQKFCDKQVGEPQDKGVNEPEDEQAVIAHRQKLDDCLAKERAKFKADVLRFRRDGRGSGTVTIYSRKGATLPQVYAAEVLYEETGSDSVKVIVKSGLGGARPICRDHQDFAVTVPNGYSIELDDSVYGKLTYDAKIGLVGR